MKNFNKTNLNELWFEFMTVVNAQILCLNFKYYLVTQSTERDSMILAVKSIAYLVVSISELARKWPSNGNKTLNETIIQRYVTFASDSLNWF